jgi:sugar lactone lactonase YvrE
MSKITNKKYKISLLIASILLFGCDFNKIQYIEDSNIYNIKASSKKGAELSFKISLKQNSFNLKANQIGTTGKFISDIDHYLIYLIKNSNTSNYPSGGDPIGDSILGPISVPASNSEQIKITGLNDSLGQAYYIAARAQDSSGNDLIKNNNGDSTPWSGDTASTTLKIAVSDFGVVVDNSLAVSPKNNLLVTINLTDEIGNSLGVNTSVNNGSLIHSTSRILDNYIVTLAGTTTNGFTPTDDGNAATLARLDKPDGVALDNLGNIYIADTENHRIRKVDTSGVITTIAGSDSANIGDFSGDGGQATLARLKSPSGIVLDALGNIYISDSSNFRIRKVDTSGVITTIAGNGTQCVSFPCGDGGQATDANISIPFALALDDEENLYFSDPNVNRVRKIGRDGIISTVAGNGGSIFTPSEDGNQATNAQINFPKGIHIDNFGNLYISDSNNRIRKVNKAGIISTIAGGGVLVGDGGQATSAKLINPDGIVSDISGNIYISDKGQNRIRKINALGIISTIAGNGTAAFSGNNVLSTSSQVSSPSLLTIDSFGNLYIADKNNSRIRKIYAN